ncbi:class I SAM-dependent methyltransferase [Cytobacillus purgationiresistens]|uniref:Ubiquinone/menaquinone biosynthesis C-methylase UbiE n=1 Tax=Cytobacillus purgationiresistens TaxID=863449 RepID=A0ABU0AJ49_9BACI|nr:class I SAM-dependent methyltransferase [Cytobacillus purgationiresistens]MDQ0271291.1 ubiquinone/menaquinone biosynthesis C-methylase UbiE [Cytobacillus purgationiresistens]
MLTSILRCGIHGLFEGGEWSLPISHQDFVKGLDGQFDMYLTPYKPVPQNWFIPLDGTKVLGLASGGGQQCPVFAAQQADVTVFDYSNQQLELEKMVVEREGSAIEIIKGDMSKRLPFEDESFDMIFHPVSNGYVEDVEHVWKECHRILKKGGGLLAGFTNPALYLFGEGENRLTIVNKLPFKGHTDQSEEELVQTGGIQLSHSLETQIGGQLKAGFQLQELYEDHHHKVD